MSEMHKYLTSMDKYNQRLPFYVDNLFTDDQISRIKNLLDINKMLDPFIIGDRVEDGYTHESEFRSRYQPKIAKSMSRMLLEFEMPKDCENTLDSIAKPLYDGDIALCHYNYIDYNLKYGYGDNSPALPPHLDADENLVTINYCLDTNIDWDLYVSTPEDSSKFEKYSLKSGQTLVFSAVNQIHWRPKRKFKDGEFCKIISMDYCPTNNYRFTGENNPLDPEKNITARKEYLDELHRRKDMISAFDLWNDEGKQNGIDVRSFG